MQMQQGDVCLELVETLPETARLVAVGVQSHPVAYGEASGHAHLVECEDPFDVYSVEDGEMVTLYLRATSPVKVRHGKLFGKAVVASPGAHGLVEMGAGVIRVNQVYEADPFSEMVRQVED